MTQAVYVTPDGAYSGTYPSLRRRVAAGAIDWTLCYVLYLLVSIPVGMVQDVARVSWEAGDLGGLPGQIVFHALQPVVLAPIGVYFALFWRTGSTLGMRAADIELLCAGSGEQPGLRRTIPRAVLAVVLGSATYVAFVFVTGEPPLGGYTDAARVAIAVSVALFVTAVLAKLWIVLDARRQTLFDKLFGLVYVEDLVSNEPAAALYELWLSRRAP